MNDYHRSGPTSFLSGDPSGPWPGNLGRGPNTEIKLTVKAIPGDPIEYPGWRFSLKSKILGLHMPTTFLFDFIETIDKEELSVLIGTETREMYLALDAKLFSVLVEAVS